MLCGDKLATSYLHFWLYETICGAALATSYVHFWQYETQFVKVLETPFVKWVSGAGTPFVKWVSGIVLIGVINSTLSSVMGSRDLENGSGPIKWVSAIFLIRQCQDHNGEHGIYLEKTTCENRRSRPFLVVK